MLGEEGALPGEMLANETVNDAWGLRGVMPPEGHTEERMGLWNGHVGSLYHPVYLRISSKKVKPLKTILCFLQVHMHTNTDMFNCLQACAPNRQRRTPAGWDGGWGGVALHADVTLHFGALFTFYKEHA